MLFPRTREDALSAVEFLFGRRRLQRRGGVPVVDVKAGVEVPARAAEGAEITSGAPAPTSTLLVSQSIGVSKVNPLTQSPRSAFVTKPCSL